MSLIRNHGAITASLVFAVLLWGGNNAGVKFLVQTWPPIFVGATRFLGAGLILLAVIHWTDWFGRPKPLARTQRRQLWWRGGLVLAVYIIAFNVAVQLTAVSHVALYLGAAPVWALLWDGWGGLTRREVVKRALAAVLALAGVVVLFWPTLKNQEARLPGELLGLSCSVLWTTYGRQCRRLSRELSGAVITAHTMWRAGVLLLPLGLLEAGSLGLAWSGLRVGVQFYCIIAGGVMAFGLWNNALQHWRTSQVYLFNNLVPPSTMLWAHFCLGEPVTTTFGVAMVLVVSGVLVGQTSWSKLFSRFWMPEE